jgi:hypothetical protein
VTDAANAMWTGSSARHMAEHNRLGFRPSQLRLTVQLIPYEGGSSHILGEEGAR